MRHVFPKVLAIPGLPALAALTLWSLEARSNHSAPGLSFTNIASQAGLKAVTIYGGEQANRYLMETTGCGVALFDFAEPPLPTWVFRPGALTVRMASPRRE